MNDRDRLNALCAVMVRYLVPDGITAQEAISEVIELLDPLPLQREWVGLTDEEVRNEAKNHVFDESFFSGAIWARWKIKEKNNG